MPESNFITRIDDLLEQMRFHEVPKRALFSIPFELADGFVIGIKGWVNLPKLVMSRLSSRLYRYNLVSEQRKGAYKYFADLGDRMELANSRTVYVDEVRSFVGKRKG